MRRGKTGRFVGLAALGVAEVGAWVTFRTTGLVLTTVAVTAGAGAAWAMSRSTWDRRPSPQDVRRANAAKRPVNKAIK